MFYTVLQWRTLVSILDGCGGWGVVSRINFNLDLGYNNEISQVIFDFDLRWL